MFVLNRWIASLLSAMVMMDEALVSWCRHITLRATLDR